MLNVPGLQLLENHPSLSFTTTPVLNSVTQLRSLGGWPHQIQNPHYDESNRYLPHQPNLQPFLLVGQERLRIAVPRRRRAFRQSIDPPKRPDRGIRLELHPLTVLVF